MRQNAERLKTLTIDCLAGRFVVQWFRIFRKKFQRNSERIQAHMNLALFSELQLDDSTIKQYTLLVPSEITFTKCDSNTVTWPFSGLLSKRLWGSDIDDAQRLEVWSKHTFTEPSLVYVQFEFFPMGTSKVPVNGITIGKACFVCICFNSSDTPNVPVDVIQRTTIHELGHLA